MHAHLGITQRHQQTFRFSWYRLWVLLLVNGTAEIIHPSTYLHFGTDSAVTEEKSLSSVPLSMTKHVTALSPGKEKRPLKNLYEVLLTKYSLGRKYPWAAQNKKNTYTKISITHFLTRKNTTRVFWAYSIYTLQAEIFSWYNIVLYQFKQTHLWISKDLGLRPCKLYWLLPLACMVGRQGNSTGSLHKDVMIRIYTLRIHTGDLWGATYLYYRAPSLLWPWSR